MAISAATIPTPPRLTGNAQADNASIVNWAYDLYRVVVVEQQIPNRLNAIATIPAITTGISGSPTQAEVEELRDKINAIITASAPATGE